MITNIFENWSTKIKRVFWPSYSGRLVRKSIEIYYQGNFHCPQLRPEMAQWGVETLIFDLHATCSALSLGLLSIVPWAASCFIEQGNLTRRASLFCYWESPQQSFKAIL